MALDNVFVNWTSGNDTTGKRVSMIITPQLISANLGYRPWMGRHAAASFYFWPKTTFIHRHHPLEPRY